MENVVSASHTPLPNHISKPNRNWNAKTNLRGGCFVFGWSLVIPHFRRCNHGSRDVTELLWALCFCHGNKKQWTFLQYTFRDVLHTSLRESPKLVQKIGSIFCPRISLIPSSVVPRVGERSMSIPGKVKTRDSPSTFPSIYQSTTSVLTSTKSAYATSAGITAAAGTRLAHQLILTALFTKKHPSHAPLNVIRW